MTKNSVKFKFSSEIFNSDENEISWNDFMEKEIQDSQDNIVIDREEDF